MTFKIVTRKEWKAKPSKHPHTLIRPKSVTVHYDGGDPVKVADVKAEMAKVRSIQTYHMEGRGKAGLKNFQDIAYSYLIGPSGNVYVGRGVQARTAANGTSAGNDQSLAVYFMIGADQPLTQPMLESWVKLRTTVLNKLPVKLHRQWLNVDGSIRTECPGKHLVEAYKLGYLQLDAIPTNKV